VELFRFEGILKQKRELRLWQIIEGSIKHHVDERLKELLDPDARVAILHRIITGESSPYLEADKLMRKLG
jgi:hypothetical protein